MPNGMPKLEGDLSSWCPPLVAGALCGVAALMSALLGSVVLVRLVRLMLATLRARGVRRQAWLVRLGIGEDAAAVYPRVEDRSEHAGQGKL